MQNKVNEEFSTSNADRALHFTLFQFLRTEKIRKKSISFMPASDQASSLYKISCDLSFIKRDLR